MRVIHGPEDRVLLAVLCFDGLEPDLVEEFDIKALLQSEHGQTDTEGVTRQTPVLWASFLTGRRDHGVQAGVIERDYFKKQNISSLSDFDSCLCIHVPPVRPWGQYLNSYVYNVFQGKTSTEDFLTREYLWYNHEKQETLEAIKTKNNIVISHFIISDHVGHAFRNDEKIMRNLYEELGRFTENINGYVDGAVLVVSDHGMEPRPLSVHERGKCGYHARHGFYSISESWNLKNPVHITRFYKPIVEYLDKHRAINHLTKLGYFEGL